MGNEISIAGFTLAIVGLVLASSGIGGFPIILGGILASFGFFMLIVGLMMKEEKQPQDNYCNNCKRQISGEFTFCPYCSKPVK